MKISVIFDSLGHIFTLVNGAFWWMTDLIFWSLDKTRVIHRDAVKQTVSDTHQRLESFDTVLFYKRNL